MLGEALEVAPVEERDPDVGIPLAQLAQLPVLAGDERLLHGGYLDVEVLLGEIEVGREGFGHAPVVVLFEYERPRLVFPRNVVVVEHLGALELGGTREPRRFGAAIRLEHRELQLHRQTKVPMPPDAEKKWHKRRLGLRRLGASCPTLTSLG